MKKETLRKGSTIVSSIAVLLIGSTVLTYQACGDFATTAGLADQSSVSQAVDCLKNSESLNTQAEKIITTNCQSCHDKAGLTTGLNAFHAVFDIDKMIAEGDLVAGDAPSSLIYQKISPGHHGAPSASAGSAVSAGGISQTDIQTVANWINQGLIACADTGAGGASAIGFALRVAPILSLHKCVSCHATPSTANGNVGLSTFADAVKTVVAGSPMNSILIVALPAMTGSAYSNSPMTTAEIATITTWISEGARK